MSSVTWVCNFKQSCHVSQDQRGEGRELQEKTSFALEIVSPYKCYKWDETSSETWNHQLLLQFSRNIISSPDTSRSLFIFSALEFVCFWHFNWRVVLVLALMLPHQPLLHRLGLPRTVLILNCYWIMFFIRCLQNWDIHSFSLLISVTWGLWIPSFINTEYIWMCWLIDVCHKNILRRQI